VLRSKAAASRCGGEILGTCACCARFCLMTQDRIAVGLITAGHSSSRPDLRSTLAGPRNAVLAQLLQAIDEADREMWRDRDALDTPETERA
jgi:hypothetical protein